MGLIIQAILRKVIMSVATGAVVTLGENMIDGTIKTLVAEVRDREGVTELTAKEVVGDILSDLAINSGLIFTTLQTGLGVKSAEWLGLTSKGVIKKGQSIVSKKALSAGAGAVIKKIAGPWEKFKSMSLVSKLITGGGIVTGITWIGVGIANVIEPFIYKPKEANDAWEQVVGFRPFADPAIKLNPGPFTTTSSVTFTDFAKSLETQGVTGLSSPVRFQSLLYSRDELAAIVDFIYGQEVVNGRALSVKEIIPKISQYLIIPGRKTVLAPAGISSSPVYSTHKVFTGIVSQGVVGKGLIFTSRPDDLIESEDELRQAAANNLAPYLNTLLGKIVYEVKVVASVITKDGFRQSGKVQRIQNGTYSNGQPKYKTVTNKFATLVIYALTDKGSRAKLSTIVLGPTNSAKLTVAQNQLRELELALPKLVTTNDVKEIKEVKGKDADREPEKTFIASAPKDKKPSGDFDTSKRRYTSKRMPDGTIFIEWLSNTGVLLDNGFYKETDPFFQRALREGWVKLPEAAASATGKPGADANTLSEWYAAQGAPVPSVEARSLIYAGFNLGQASFYTGTAEQNTKLLDALKQ